jgi:hypothetical protein
MTSPRKKRTPNKPANQGGMPRWDIVIVQSIQKIGISGTIIAVLLYNFIVNGTIEQKRELIDTFVLLKFPKDRGEYFFFIVICLVVSYFITIYHYRGRLRIRDEKIKYLEDEIIELQSRLKPSPPKK